MASISKLLISIRDHFLLPAQVKKIKEDILLLERSEKTLRVSYVIFACLAVYYKSFPLLIPAYLCVESSAIVANAQEIHEDVIKTMSVARNKTNCENQIFKSAPLFRMINWIIRPYINLEERTQNLIKDCITTAMKNRYRL